MNWDRSETLALATYHCARCHGAGLLVRRQGTGAPCNCVLRNIFRACYARFLDCMVKEKHMSRVQLDKTSGGMRKYFWSRKDEEYAADFILVSRRTLTDEEYRVFKFHYLLGADWKLCCRRLNTDRGNFFHTVYRIEQKLGRVYRELRPYALFPLDEYFGNTVSNESVDPAASRLFAADDAVAGDSFGPQEVNPFVRPIDRTAPRKRGPVQPPILKAA